LVSHPVKYVTGEREREREKGERERKRDFFPKRQFTVKLLGEA